MGFVLLLGQCLVVCSQIFGLFWMFRIVLPSRQSLLKHVLLFKPVKVVRFVKTQKSMSMFVIQMMQR